MGQHRYGLTGAWAVWGRALVASVTGIVCAIALVGTTPGRASANPSPPPPPSPARATTTVPDKALEALRRKLDDLYHDAGVATDAYNAAEEKAAGQSAAIDALDRRITAARVRLAGLRDRAGAAARAQYRGGGLLSEARLMLSDDPGEFLDGADRARQGEHAAEGLLTGLTRTQRELEEDAGEARARWQKLEQGRRQKAAAKSRIERRIAAAEELASRPRGRDRQRLAELERAAARRAQAAWLGSGVLGAPGLDPGGNRGGASTRGRRAVAFATAQLGKPYVWGATGPASYDCSGLTSRAWAAAGLPVPRTSQEQWRLLPHVRIGDMRPGDLIVYFPDASHVGIYVGNGLVLHAPRPGRNVTTTGAGTMPILGVVRPDAR